MNNLSCEGGCVVAKNTIWINELEQLIKMVERAEANKEILIVKVEEISSLNTKSAYLLTNVIERTPDSKTALLQVLYDFRLHAEGCYLHSARRK